MIGDGKIKRISIECSTVLLTLRNEEINGGHLIDLETHGLQCAETKIDGIIMKINTIYRYRFVLFGIICVCVSLVRDSNSISYIECSCRAFVSSLIRSLACR